MHRPTIRSNIFSAKPLSTFVVFLCVFVAVPVRAKTDAQMPVDLSSRSTQGEKVSAEHVDDGPNTRHPASVTPQADSQSLTGSPALEAQNATPGIADVVRLDSVWKFKTDPMRIGTLPANKWYAEDFDDASWSNLRSGRPWESQGVNYSGYAWYRQRILLPDHFAGAPLKLTLAEIASDDEVYFNGIKIGGLKGDYKYRNLLLRTYYVPARLVRPQARNTLAIRLWGGKLGFQGAKSGLVAGQYTVETARFDLAATDVGAGPDQERPIQLYDLSSAQQGHAFKLIFRFDPQTTPADGAFSYNITDFYGGVLTSGGENLLKGSDGILRGIVAIDEEISRKIYLAGRFKALALLKQPKTGAVLSQNIISADHLSFAERDELTLPTLPETYETTSYGKLKLIDEIDAATPIEKELHPYLQSGFGVHAQDFMTPGAKADVTVTTILGRAAREANWSWFAYRLGRGKLVPGQTYVVRVTYPEDKPRFSPIEIQSGQNYMDVGWKNGVASDDVYDNWPLSRAWQDYDVIVPLGTETVGTGGAGDGDASHGFWVYFMDQRKPGYYLSDYQGGAAVASIKLYEIDAKADAPHLNLPPANLPHRTMTFDWERQPTSPPADIIAYARLMGYSAVSPTILKWGLTSFAAPAPGFTSAGVDAARYWVTSPYGQGADLASPLEGQTKSVHEQYLDATRAGGIDYMPRVEYGGSNVLPVWARAIGADGRLAKPDRFAAWGADLLNPATFSDFKAYIDGLFRPYASLNPQLRGMLWRIREDRMQISFARDDISLFARETSISPPTNANSATPAEAAEWATTPPIAPMYADWWQKKRAGFHAQIAQLLKGYRSDMSLLYFNWDQDKFSLMQPDRESGAFFQKIQALGGPIAYDEDRAKRKGYSAADYTSILETGLFSGSLPQIRRPGSWPDYALRPSLYSKTNGVQLLAPVPGLPYANMPDYLNYFRTQDGLAVSDMVSYDEIGAREVNPKFEGAVVLPGGAPFSMAVELLAYYYGDVRTLTYTSYTYGRGFADAHRRFAQAFRALPAIAGTLVQASEPTDVATRIYKTADRTYIGVAYKGYRSRHIQIDIAGPWKAGMTLMNLVTNEKQPAYVVDGKLRIEIVSGPMELQAFLVR